ncbi:MAG: gamma-glutamylcyclotransferase [Rhodospirillaceae bacterium]|nr:gamma-glutamylcyclotransferase [Rhodospirillaceae bacterium]
MTNGASRKRGMAAPITVETGGGSPLWVFAYGSLMWDPGFDYVEHAPAVVRGYRRAFCVLSMSHRGTPERPGLVLGLAPGGTCRGMIYRVAPEREAEVQAYLFERERRRYDVYRESLLRARHAGGTVLAQSYVADPSSSGYAGDLAEHEIARRIVEAHGERGPNFDYLERTLGQLQTLAIREPEIERIYAMAVELRAAPLTSPSPP